MPIAGNAFFIAQSLGHGHTQGNSYVFSRVMSVNVQITFRLDGDIDHTVTGNLINHVLKKRYACFKITFSSPVQINIDFDTGFVCITFYRGFPC